MNVLGLDILLVGELSWTELFAASLKDVAKEHEDNNNNKQRNNTSNKRALPPAVALLQQRLQDRPRQEYKQLLLSRKDFHHMDNLSSSSASSQKIQAMDHIVLLVSYCEQNPHWRQETAKFIAEDCSILKHNAWQNKVTVVAIPWNDATFKYEPEKDSSPQQIISDDFTRRVPILVCQIQQANSRNTVANMIWNRIQHSIGPCSPLLAI